MPTFSDSYAIIDRVSVALGVPRTVIALSVQNFLQQANYFTTIDINDSIQDAVNQVSAFTGCIYKSAIIPFTANTTYYDFLTLIPDYIGVVSIFNTVTRSWLSPTSVRKFDNLGWNWETLTGTPELFAPINHRYVAICKKPIVSNYGNMYVFYKASAPTLDDNTQIPIPVDNLDVVEHYVILDLWEQNQEFSKATNFFPQYMDSVEKLRVMLHSKKNIDRLPGLK